MLSTKTGGDGSCLRRSSLDDVIGFSPPVSPVYSATGSDDFLQEQVENTRDPVVEDKEQPLSSIPQSQGQRRESAHVSMPRPSPNTAELNEVSKKKIGECRLTKFYLFCF